MCLCVCYVFLYNCFSIFCIILLRYIFRSYHHDGIVDGGGLVGEVGPQISADLDGFEEEEIHHIEFERDSGGFGFSIRGGAEFNSHMFVLRIAEGGAADNDGRLRASLI